MKKFLFVAALTAATAACTSNPVNDRDPAASGGPSKAKVEAALSNPDDRVTLEWGRDTFETMKSCKGSVSLKRDGGTLKLVVKDAQSCSNVYYDNPADPSKGMEQVGKLAGGAGTEEIALNEKFGRNDFDVLLTSNSGATSAKIHVVSFVEPPRRSKISPMAPADYTLSTYLFGRRWGQLSDCGGSVYMTIDSARRVSLQFFGVQKCSNFDILLDNGRATQYVKQKIDGADGNRNDTIALPNDLYSRGYNKIKLVVKSNSEATYDVFAIEFPAY